MNCNSSEMDFSKIKLYSNILLNIHLAGRNSILKDFIAFNDCQNSRLVVKRALKLLNKRYHYFTGNKEKVKKHKEDKEQENSKEPQEDLMPFDVYTSKVQQNKGLLAGPVKFRNKYMWRIDKDIDAINKLLLKRTNKYSLLQNGWEFLSKYLSDQWNLIQNRLRINHLNLE